MVPTWLGSKQALFEWSELAHEYGVQLFTDYENLGSYDELVSSLKDDKIAGSEDHLSAAALFVNLPLARPAHTYNNLPIESEGLYGSAAAPVAAQLYNRQINEAVAGKLKGHIKGVRLTRMDLRHGHINRLSKLGVIPLGCWDWNQVTAFSNNSLCQGSLPGKNVYDVKRVFNRISLDIADMCNLYLFLPDKPATYQDIKRAIIRYLEKRKDKGNFREYKILYVGPDKNEKGRIQIQLHIQPNFNIKSCTLYMLGMDGEEAPEWEIDMQSALPSEGFSGTNTK